MAQILFVDQLEIQRHPSRIIVGEYQDVNFTIVARGVTSSSGRLTYRWHRYWNSLPNGRSFGINSSSLLIKSVLEDDEGRYYCVVTNEWNNMVTSRAGTLEVICKCPSY